MLGQIDYVGPVPKVGDEITLEVTGKVTEVQEYPNGASPDVTLQVGAREDDDFEFDLGNFDRVTIHAPKPQPGDVWRNKNNHEDYFCSGHGSHLTFTSQNGISVLYDQDPAHMPDRWELQYRRSNGEVAA